MEARKLIVALGLVATLGALTGCKEEIPAQAAGDVGPKTVTQVSDMPKWYVKAPADTKEYMYVAGTGLSTDLAMAVQKAQLDAQYKLGDKLKAKLDALMQQYKADVNDASIDNTEYTIKKVIADVSVVGYTVEDQVVQNQSRSYRTYVLIKYPLGEANQIVQAALGQRAKQDATYRQAEQRNQLEKELAAQRERDAQAEDRLQKVLAPSTVE